MTNLEFKAEIRNLYIESNRFNRFWAIALIMIGLGFLLYLTSHGINVHINPNDTLAKLVATIGIIGLPLTPIVVGLLVIYKIPRQFNPTQILSSAPIDIKLKLIESSLSSYKIISREKYNEINIYNCRSRYFNYFRILFYIDSAQFLFNIQTLDIGHYYKGVFDLGVTKRITRKIKACL
jgi:hypothetical protein